MKNIKPTKEMIEDVAGVLWDDGARHHPTYQFPSREARYRAAKAAVTAVLLCMQKQK